MKNMVTSLINKLSEYRAGLMGVGIISVIAYHLYCWVNGLSLLRVFKWGFIGVDLFLFVSAFGLCFSYEKHSLSVFYVNRVKRIFPLLALYALIVGFLGCVFSLSGIGLAVKTFLLYLTTLNYYVRGFRNSDWFIPAIILLYLSFPVIKKMVDVFGRLCVLLGCIICLVLSWKISPAIGWYYDCLMSRIPVFLLGVLAFAVCKGKTKITALDVLCWFGIYVISLSFSNSRFFIATMFCPIYIIAAGLSLSSPLFEPIFRWFGTHSLELYFGHALGARMARTMFDVDSKCGFVALAIMVFAMFGGCLIFLCASKIIKKWLV